MFYAPHTLQKKAREVKRDEYNRPILTEEGWVDVCKCRCDDNHKRNIQTEEGRVYRPQYYIVCPKDTDVNPEDEIRVFKGNVLRAEGRVYDVKHLNCLDYTEIWV